MKTKLLVFVLTLGLFVSAFGQISTMKLTFIAENNGQYVPLDSIQIENITQAVDTTLYALDTVLVLDYLSSINNHEAFQGNTISVSQNYPNPFKGKTEVRLYMPEKEYIKITVRDILARELGHYEATLNQGNHTFSIYLGSEKHYLLTVTGKQTSQTIKMLNAGGHSTNNVKCEIVHTGYKRNVSYFKSQQTINDFLYKLGDSLVYTGYTNSIDGIFGSAVIGDKPQQDTIYAFDILKGLRCPGIPIVTDIEGNTYNTVQIGNQCWMKENLKTTTYKNGTAIPNVTDANTWDGLSTSAYVWYDNDDTWKDLYGALYNWYTTIDTNGLCPTGWHVPTLYEWNLMINYIGGYEFPHGSELKSCRQVNSPLGGSCNTTEHPRWAQYNTYNGTDNYGFSGLPAGSRWQIQGFSTIGGSGHWWSSSDAFSGSANFYSLEFHTGFVGIYSSSMRHGFSVRCLKD